MDSILSGFLGMFAGVVFIIIFPVGSIVEFVIKLPYMLFRRK